MIRHSLLVFIGILILMTMVGCANSNQDSNNPTAKSTTAVEITSSFTNSPAISNNLTNSNSASINTGSIATSPVLTNIPTSSSPIPIIITPTTSSSITNEPSISHPTGDSNQFSSVVIAGQKILWKTHHPGGDDYLGTDSIFCDSDNNIWIGGDRLIKFDGNSWQSFTPDFRIFSIKQDKNGTICLSGAILETLQFVIARFEEPDFIKVFSGQNLRQFFSDSNGNIWVSKGSVLSRWDGTSWNDFTNKDGLGTNQVDSITEDSNGNLWISKGKVFQFDGNFWTSFDSLFDTTFVYCDKKDRVWVSGWTSSQPEKQGYLMYHDGTSWTKIALSGDLARVPFNDVFEDKRGELWFWNQMAKLAHFDGNSMQPVFVDNQALISCHSRVELVKKTWFGMYKLYSFNGKAWDTLTDSEGRNLLDIIALSDNIHTNHNKAMIINMTEDSNGDLWLDDFSGVVIQIRLTSK